MDCITAEKIKLLRQKGHGYKKIASALSLPQSTVKSFLKRTETQTDNGTTTCLYCGKPITQTPHKRQKNIAPTNADCLGGQNTKQKQIKLLRKSAAVRVAVKSL